MPVVYILVHNSIKKRVGWPPDTNWKEMVKKAPPGFEPGAAALQVQRSTTEL